MEEKKNVTQALQTRKGQKIIKKENDKIIKEKKELFRTETIKKFWKIRYRLIKSEQESDVTKRKVTRGAQTNLTFGALWVYDYEYMCIN